MRAFLVYIDDWLSSAKIECMDAHEERGYFRLLLHEYTQPDCALPDDDKILAVWSKLGAQWWKPTKEKRLQIKGMTSGSKIRACFAPRDGRLVNERLYREWLHQQEVRQKRSIVGKKGGRPPGKQKVSSEETNRFSTENQMGKQNETNDVYVSVSPGFNSGFTEEENLTEANGVYDPGPGWRRFREEYPCIPNVDFACQQWLSVILTADEEAVQWAGLAAYRKSQRAKNEIWYEAHNWLRDKRYRGKYPPAADSSESELRKLRAL